MLEKDCALWKGPCWSSSWRTVSPMGSSGKDCILWERFCAGAGKRSEEERVAGMKCYGWIASPTPLPFCSAQSWRRVEELLTKLSQEKRKEEWWGEGFVFVSHCLPFIATKLNLSFLSPVCFGHDGSKWMISLDPWAFNCILFPILLRRGTDREPKLTYTSSYFPDFFFIVQIFQSKIEGRPLFLKSYELRLD